jgi:hypothetical protein
VKLPKDVNSAVLQVPIGTGTRVNLTAAVASSNAALPAGFALGGVILVTVTAAVWLNFGTSGVTASAANTSILVPAAGSFVYQVPYAATTTHAAVLRVGAADVPVQIETLTDKV